MKGKLTRREMLRLSTVVGAGTLIAACGGAATTAAPTAAPKAEATMAPEATKAPEAGKPVEITRKNSLILNHGGTGGKYTWVGQINPFSGVTHQEGGALLWDPLIYYSVFADKEIPWLAESATYNADFTELTLKLRKGIEWSDATPITAKDVKWTMDMQIANDKTEYHAQYAEFVSSVTASDDSTIVMKFKSPQPRFKFEVLSFKFDTGLGGCVLPSAYFEAKKTDIMKVNEEKGPDMPNSGMFKITMAPEQMVFDLRDDWWGFKTGFQKVPDVKRVIMIPLSDMATAAQRVVNNECDACLDLRATLIRTAVKSNPKITTHTGKDEPLGYVDWWPNSLWVNTALEPYSDKNVRWAMNYALDRDTIDKVVFLGAKIATIFPYPEYPALKKYLDLARPLGDKLGVRKFDLAASAKLMEGAGFKKDADGFWVKDGKRINATIDGFESIHADIVPVLVEMLRKGGFEAAIDFGNDAYQNMADGKPGLYMFGHGASVIDPVATLELYHSRYSSPIGTTAGSNHFARYKNPTFDAIVDEMGKYAIGDAKLPDLFMKAIDIYWTDMIDIPVIQWLHRIPYNQTYWTNWPTQDNPYLNGAYWHWTFPLLVLGLKAAA